MENPPEFLDTYKKSKKQIVQSLKAQKMKSSFRLKEDAVRFVDELKWAWTMPWREEQLDVINAFLSLSYDEIIVQAIFGGGKTTMMLAIIFFLVLKDRSMIEHIFVCAFNIGIKNEIKKKLKKIGRCNVKTFDSLIYTCCHKLDYPDLKLLNFETKRRFVRENLDRLEQTTSMKYVFIDESQDLEKSCYVILRHCFPLAKFMFIGDIFQSIQKEPRDSLLWYLLDRPQDTRYSIFKMIDTPRVPRMILNEIKTALTSFYPEFTDTIDQWHSTSSELDPSKIQWVQFKSYYSVYKDILSTLHQEDQTKTMILTFSSAITVRGSLGDIARFRKFLEDHHIVVNQNHKRMMDDRVFLTTANSSKGLERDYVICVLTFPLELAFANFSNDLVMNLITVALSRCKKKITFYVPCYDDRFSRVLDCFERCPQPIKIDSLPSTSKPKNALTECNSFAYNPQNLVEMLQKEHSVTEILRQNILTYETRQKLINYAQILENYEMSDNPALVKSDNPALVKSDNPALVKTEEESTFVGLLFEAMILSLWTKRYPYSNFIDITHHHVFSGHFEKISQMTKRYAQYIKSHPLSGEKNRFNGCFLYAQLHLFAHQKILVRSTNVKNQQYFKKWQSIKGCIQKIPIKTSTLKTQMNISMPFLNGILDAANVPQHKDKSQAMDIYEIKASKSPDWKQNALLQAILYGILSAKALFHVYLINVLSRHANHYKIFFKKDLMMIRNTIIQDILNWNINCFLAKNVNYKEKNDCKWDVQESIVIDGRFNKVHNKWMEFSICEFISATKTRITIISVDEEIDQTRDIENEFQEILEKYKSIYNIKTLLGCPEICKNQVFIEKYNIVPILQVDWETYKMQFHSETTEMKLDFQKSYNTLALIVCSLYKKYK